MDLRDEKPAATPLEHVLRVLSGLFIVGVSGLILYIAYPSFGRYLEVRALEAGGLGAAELLSLQENPVARCQDWWLLGRLERCSGVGTAYTVLTLEKGGEVFSQRYFPTRLIGPLALSPGAEVRVAQHGRRVVVDERAYGYVPLTSETLQADLWILLSFSLPLALFWWFRNNIDRLLYPDV